MVAEFWHSTGVDGHLLGIGGLAVALLAGEVEGACRSRIWSRTSRLRGRLRLARTQPGLRVRHCSTAALRSSMPPSASCSAISRDSRSWAPDAPLECVSAAGSCSRRMSLPDSHHDAVVVVGPDPATHALLDDPSAGCLRKAASGSHFHETGGREVLVEREGLAQPAVPHDTKAGCIDVGVHPLVVLAKPLPGRHLLIVGDPVDD